MSKRCPSGRRRSPENRVAASKVVGDFMNERLGSSVPLVSCVMPTHNRRQFVAQALWYFLRQDYPRKELVILDDGEDVVAELVPPDERIRYVRLDRSVPLGAKRNVGCE